MVPRLTAALLATAALALPAAAAAAGVPGRESDPIVVTGADVPALLGVEPGRVVAFRWDGGWTQVPVQVDQRTMVDYAAVRHQHQTGGRPFSHLAYADPGTFAGPDSDPALDSDDELAAMALDAGDGAPVGAGDPSGVERGTRVELRIADPVDPGPTHFLYLFRSTGALDPSAGRDYVSYRFSLNSGDYKSTYSFNGVPGGDSTSSGPPANPENSLVDSDYYRERFASRWITDELGIRAPGSSGADVLDGDKAQVSFGCGRSELTFSRGGGGFIANIDGPVRAIRSYIGANSGTYTQRDQVFYQRSQVDRTYLRVHPGIATISQFIDYSAAASGMTYRTSAAPGGVIVDGSPDPSIETGTTPGAPFTWEQATGQQGTLSIVSRLSTNLPNLGLGSYYEDTASPAASQCSGYADSRTYGASGLVVTNAGLNTDPTLEGAYGPAYNFTATRRIYFSEPGGDAALAAMRASQVDAPLQVSLGAPDSSDLRLRSRKLRRAPVGASKKLRVLVSNRADAAVSGIRLCASGKRKLVRVGRCHRLGEITAGEQRKAFVRVRLRPRALGRKAVNVRITLEVGGVSVNDARLRVRPRRG